MFTLRLPRCVLQGIVKALRSLSPPGGEVEKELLLLDAVLQSGGSEAVWRKKDESA